MSVTRSSHIVGAFTDRTVADQVVEKLLNAGFENEQIYYFSPGTSGGFFEGLKNLLTGTSSEANNLIYDLTDMGLSDEEAQHYVSEYNSGNTLLAVNTPDRQAEVLSILHEYGASSVGGGSISASATTESTQQSSNSIDINDYTNAEAELQNRSIDTEVQPQHQTIEDQSPEHHVEETATPVALEATAEETEAPVASETTVEEATPVASETAVEETEAPVASETTVEETEAPVASETAVEGSNPGSSQKRQRQMERRKQPR